MVSSQRAEPAGIEAARIERELRAAGSAERAASGQNYLKSRLEFCGTTVPEARAIVTAWRRDHPALTRQGLTEVVAALWDSSLFECRMAAVLLITDRRRLLRQDDAGLVEQMLRTSGTWALVDGLAADVMGALVERFPELTATLDRWAVDENLWIRRSAMLALLVPLRRGDPANFDRFAGYADSMLDEHEFFIRKAIGWVLRETGKKNPELVAGWVAARIGRASGVTVREAVKWLPATEGAALLGAYRQQRLAAAGRHTKPRQPKPEAG